MFRFQFTFAPVGHFFILKNNNMGAVKSKQIVFITGAFVHHSCWDNWRKFFDERGYETIAPPRLYKDGANAEALRKRQPEDVNLATLTLDRLINYHAEIVSSRPEKPIIIGHSFGGMMTQVLVNRGLAAAGVAIHSFPPQGIFPYEFSFFKAAWRALGLFTPIRKTYLMSFETWQYAFVNGMPLEEQQEAYDQLTIPESKTVSRGGLTKAASVDWSRPHVPLLLTAGGQDTIIPAHLNRRNFNRYPQNGSVTEFKEMPDRNHFVLGQPGWEGDAQFVYDWIQKQ